MNLVKSISKTYKHKQRHMEGNIYVTLMRSHKNKPKLSINFNLLLKLEKGISESTMAAYYQFSNTKLNPMSTLNYV